MGRCARRILLLAGLPAEEPSVIPAARPGRAAAESHRRALHRLAGLDLLELGWTTETLETARKATGTGVQWDEETGTFLDVEPATVAVARSIERRTARLTELGAVLVREMCGQLRTGKRIRWPSAGKSGTSSSCPSDTHQPRGM